MEEFLLENIEIFKSLEDIMVFLVRDGLVCYLWRCLRRFFFLYFEFF